MSCMAFANVFSNAYIYIFTYARLSFMKSYRYTLMKRTCSRVQSDMNKVMINLPNCSRIYTKKRACQKRNALIPLLTNKLS